VNLCQAGRFDAAALFACAQGYSRAGKAIISLPHKYRLWSICNNLQKVDKMANYCLSVTPRSASFHNVI
jgi:hypothetical protein